VQIVGLISSVSILDRCMWTVVACANVCLTGGTCEHFNERSDIIIQQITSSSRELLYLMKSVTYSLTYLVTYVLHGAQSFLRS